jgi:hypothetical protein
VRRKNRKGRNEMPNVSTRSPRALVIVGVFATTVSAVLNCGITILAAQPAEGNDYRSPGHVGNVEGRARSPGADTRSAPRPPAVCAPQPSVPPFGPTCDLTPDGDRAPPDSGHNPH